MRICLEANVLCSNCLEAKPSNVASVNAMNRGSYREAIPYLNSLGARPVPFGYAYRGYIIKTGLLDWILTGGCPCDLSFATSVRPSGLPRLPA